MTKAARRFIFGPEAHIAFIGANEQTIAFLAQVVFTVPVRDRGQAPSGIGDFFDGFRHEILVFRGHQRQLDAGHPRDLASPKPGCVDDPFRRNVAFGRLDEPSPIGLLNSCRYRCETVNLCTACACAGCVCHRDARRVDVAAIGFIHNATNAVEIHKWVEPFSLISADLVEVHSIVTGLCFLQQKLVLARFRLRKVKRTWLKHPTTLACLGL